MGRHFCLSSPFRVTQGTGEADCQACGYNYSPKVGDDEYPVPRGTRFEVRLGVRRPDQQLRAL